MFPNELQMLCNCFTGILFFIGFFYGHDARLKTSARALNQARDSFRTQSCSGSSARYIYINIIWIQKSLSFFFEKLSELNQRLLLQFDSDPSKSTLWEFLTSWHSRMYLLEPNIAQVERLRYWARLRVFLWLPSWSVVKPELFCVRISFCQVRGKS